MTDRFELYGFQVERFVSGTTTTPIGFTAIAGQNAIAFKLIAGGTFEIVSGSSFVAGNGFPFTATGEVLTMDASGTVYGMVSGATCTVAVLRGRSAGFPSS